MAESPTLTVTWQGAVRTFRLDSDKALRLGRHPASEVPFDPQRDLIVSSSHAKIVRLCGNWTLVDLESRNGVWVSGRDGRRRIARLELQGGEEFELGRGGPIVRFERPPGEMRNTKKVEILQVPSLPTARTVQMGDRPISIGREFPVDVQIADPRVSRKHATVVPTETGHRLVDHESRNGTFVNGERISSRLLVPGDRVIIGGRRIEYQPDALTITETDTGAGLEAKGLGREREGKTALDDVWIAAAPGDLIAVMGPSRCGKTSLLDALVGLRAADRGTVNVGGIDLYECPEAVRGWVGHVGTEDALYDDLTVASSLSWAAAMRLPGDHSEKERLERIEKVLADVEMTNHRDRPVGRLTQAQRRRLMLGLELLTEPAVLCLDEPTAGMDPSESFHLVRLLRELAGKGRSVIASVRSVAHLDVFDRVCFLMGGRLTFFGRPGEALTHFDVTKYEDLYHACRERDSEEWRDRYRVSSVCKRFLPEYWVDRTEPTSYDPGAGPAFAGADPASGVPRAVPRTRGVEPIKPDPGGMFSGAEWNTIGRSLKLLAPPLKQLSARTPAGGLREVARQLVVLVRRDVERQYASKDDLLWLAAGAPLLIGLLVGMAAPRPDAAMLWLGLSAWWLAAQRAAGELARDRPAFRRDRRMNLRVFSYLVARFVPLAVTASVQALVVLATVMHLSGLNLPLLPAAALVVLTACAGSAAGLAVSAMAANPNQAHAVVAILLMLNVLFSGAFEPDTGPPPRGVVATIDRLSAGYWTFDELKRMAIARGSSDRASEDSKIAELDARQDMLATRLNGIGASWRGVTTGLTPKAITSVGGAAAQLDARKRLLEDSQTRLTDLAKEYQDTLDLRVQATGNLRDAERRRNTALASNHLGSSGAAFGWLFGLVIAGLGLASLLLRWRELSDEL